MRLQAFDVNLRRVAEQDILRNYLDEGLELESLCSTTGLLISRILFLIVMLIAID